MTDKTLADDDQGMVMYFDGAANPTNPGYVGFGVHGYLFSATPPKKGAGNADNILTNYGYVAKLDKPKLGPTYREDGLLTFEISPIAYFDAVGSQVEPGTNNHAELSAVELAIRKACEYPIKEVIFIGDSKYVLDGIDRCPKWEKFDWIKPDGEPVKNVALWKSIVSGLNILKTRGTVIRWDWVRGHGDGVGNSCGNNIADALSVIGSRRSAFKEQKVEFTTTVAAGYWKEEVERSPFLFNRRMYFNSNKETHIAGEYYLGEHGKDDEMLGKRIPDGAYSVVQLKEPNPVLEFIRGHQSDLTNALTGIETSCMARCDALFTPHIYKNTVAYGRAFFTRAKTRQRNELITVDQDIPITRELRPPLLAMRSIESLSSLKAILEAYRERRLDTYTLTNITSVLYDITTEEKKGKVSKIVKLKPEYNVGFVALPVEINVTTDKGALKVKNTLTLGIDMPDRNFMKRLEHEALEVYVISWNEAPDVVRYATIIEREGDFGIWAGFYSNLIFLPEAKTE